MPRCAACGKKNLSGFAFCQKCGARLDDETAPAAKTAVENERREVADADGFQEQLNQFLEQGNKIGAIKLYRERTGAGLAEAKKAVEQMQVDVIFAESDLEPQLLAMLHQGQKIEAIKTYRQRTRSGLKDAKDAVEALAAKHGLATRRAGCASVLLVILALVAGSLGRLAPAAGPDSPRRPNIVFIMSDDHAAHAIGAYGSRVNQTPHLDRLAAEGMRFANCFVTNSICTPSRAVILTGKYSHLNGVPVFNRFDGSQPTLPKYLQAAGYHTGMIGKWHLGGVPTGFDEWTILPGQGVYFNPTFFDADGKRTLRGYVTDAITDLAIDFMRRRPPDRPFFLMCHHKAPHRGWEPDEKHRAQFAGREIPEPATLRDDYATRSDALRENRQRVFDDLTRQDLKLVPPPRLSPQQTREWLQVKPTEVEIEIGGGKRTLTGEELNRWKYQRYMQDYLACVQSVDDNVGRLLDWLDENGLSENTIVVYTSDQGFFLGDHGLYDKRFMYEASLRTPLIVRWPKFARPGSVEDAIALNCDFAPTLLEAAGLEVPSDVQGRSLVPLLRGERPADWRTSMYYRYYHDPGHHNTRAHYGVRTATHKLIYYWKKDQWELFDLVRDPDELVNLYGERAHQALAEQLKADLYRLKRELKDDDQFATEQPTTGVDGPPF